MTPLLPLAAAGPGPLLAMPINQTLLGYALVVGIVAAIAWAAIWAGRR